MSDALQELRAYAAGITRAVDAIAGRAQFGRLYILHGRLNPHTGGTDVDGNERDDWGFDGPELAGVSGIHWTYGNPNVYFIDAEHAAAANRQTGWRFWDDNALEMEFEDDCLRLYNRDRARHEYFGDWGIK